MQHDYRAAAHDPELMVPPERAGAALDQAEPGCC
jgi:hypothetical protein